MSFMTGALLKIVAPIAGLVLLAFLALSWLEDRDEAAFKRGWEKAMAEVQERELAAERRGREQERANVLTANKEAKDARTQVQALHNALGDSERSGRRLRDALETAKLVRCAGAPRPAPAGGGAATPEAERVRAELYARYVEAAADAERQVDEAGRRVEVFADRAHIAGTACQRIYEQVNK